MKLHQQAEAEAILLQKFKGLFDALDSSWADALSLFGVGAAFGEGISEDRRLCLMAVYTKMVRLVFAADNLCRAGLGLEAQLQARTMFENYLQLKFLDHSGNIDATATEYIFWDMANDEGVDEKIIAKHPELKPKIEAAKKNLLTFKTGMSEGDWREFVFRGPSRRSVSKLSQHIDELEKSKTQHKIYETLYHETSGQAHGFDFLDYARRLSHTDLEARLSPSEEKIESVLVTALILLLNTCQIVNNKLALGQNEIIAKMDKTVNAAVKALPIMA